MSIDLKNTTVQNTPPGVVFGASSNSASAPALYGAQAVAALATTGMRFSVTSAQWYTLPPGLPRLKLTGTGSISADSRDAVSGGTVSSAVYTASVSGVTNQIHFPYFGDAAVEFRITITGSLTVEIL